MPKIRIAFSDNPADLLDEDGGHAVLSGLPAMRFPDVKAAEAHGHKALAGLSRKWHVVDVSRTAREAAGRKADAAAEKAERKAPAHPSK